MPPKKFFVRSTVFDRCSTTATLQKLAVEYLVHSSALNRSYQAWVDNFSDYQLQGLEDVNIPLLTPVRAVSLKARIKAELIETTL